MKEQSSEMKIVWECDRCGTEFATSAKRTEKPITCPECGVEESELADDGMPVLEVLFGYDKRA